MLMFRMKYALVGYPAMYILVLPPAWAALLSLQVTMHEFYHPIQLLSHPLTHTTFLFLLRSSVCDSLCNVLRI